MLTKPQVQNAIPESKPKAEPGSKPAPIGLRGRMIALAIVPVILSGAATLFAVYNTVPAAINSLYETQTNQMVRVLMGNIDFTNPEEIERELRQAMGSSTVIGMHLTQINANGQRRTQLIFRDSKAQTVFEAREPAYLKAVAEGPDATDDYFTQINFQNTNNNDWILRGFGHGGRYGATDIKMFGLADTGTLTIPRATATESGFRLVVIDDQEIQDGRMRFVGGLAVATIVAALLLARLGAVVFARSLLRPIVKLTKLADAMSTGDLETPIEIRSRDELGKLGEALERTRLSLRLAIERTQRKRAERNQQ
jgi:methyl-accepting chemotaxis protein